MTIYANGFGSCINCGTYVEETVYWLNSYGSYFNDKLCKPFCDANCSLDFLQKYGIRGEVNNLDHDFWVKLNKQLTRNDDGS